MCFVNFYCTALLINIIYRHAIFQGNSGFQTLQIDNIGVFSLLDVLLLPSKENIIFPTFCGKYERKQWHVFIYFAVEYFSWILYCKIFFISTFTVWTYCLLSFSQRIFHYLTHCLRFFTGSTEKTGNGFLLKFF